MRTYTYPLSGKFRTFGCQYFIQVISVHILIRVLVYTVLLPPKSAYNYTPEVRIS